MKRRRPKLPRKFRPRRPLTSDEARLRVVLHGAVGRTSVERPWRASTLHTAKPPRSQASKSASRAARARRLPVRRKADSALRHPPSVAIPSALLSGPPGPIFTLGPATPLGSHLPPSTAATAGAPARPSGASSDHFHLSAESFRFSRSTSFNEEDADDEVDAVPAAAIAHNPHTRGFSTKLLHALSGPAAKHSAAASDAAKASTAEARKADDGGGEGGHRSSRRLRKHESTPVTTPRKAQPPSAARKRQTLTPRSTMLASSLSSRPLRLPPTAADAKSSSPSPPHGSPVSSPLASPLVSPAGSPTAAAGSLLSPSADRSTRHVRLPTSPGASLSSRSLLKRSLKSRFGAAASSAGSASSSFTLPGSESASSSLAHLSNRRWVLMSQQRSAVEFEKQLRTRLEVLAHEELAGADAEHSLPAGTVPVPPLQLFRAEPDSPASPSRSFTAADISMGAERLRRLLNSLTEDDHHDRTADLHRSGGGSTAPSGGAVGAGFAAMSDDEDEDTTLNLTIRMSSGVRRLSNRSAMSALFPRPASTSSGPSAAAAPSAALSAAGRSERSVSPSMSDAEDTHRELRRMVSVVRKRSLEKKKRDSQIEQLIDVERERSMQELERQRMEQCDWEVARERWWGTTALSRGSWRTIYVFIASTFRDMHGERDVVVREVFPTLNERCKSRQLRLVPIDLRWGITLADTQVMGALELCLQEIDRARPFFVCFVGERYGWIPPEYKVSVDRPAFEWVKRHPPGHSITSMELHHGCLRSTLPTHAFAYLRDPTFMVDVPDDVLWVFQEDAPGSLAKLVSLRGKIERHRYMTHTTYDCAWAPKAGEENVQVAGLESLRDTMIADLNDAVCCEFPAVFRAPTQMETQRLFHVDFMEERAHRFVGRRPLLANMWQSLHRAGRAGLPLVVAGRPGCGKTSLVAYFAKLYSTIYAASTSVLHFIGCSPTSSDVRHLLLRMSHELVDAFVLDDAIPEDYVHLKEAFRSILEQSFEAAEDSGLPVFIVIDALNQLSHSYGAHNMDWMPEQLPVWEEDAFDADPAVVEAAEEAAAAIAGVPLAARDAARDAAAAGAAAAAAAAAAAKAAARGGGAAAASAGADAASAAAAAEAAAAAAAAAADELPFQPEVRPALHILLSTVGGDVLEALQRRKPPVPIVWCGALTESDKRHLVQSTLSEFRKKLTDEQMAALLKNTDSNLPLYLRIACEELRLHGQYGIAGELVLQKVHTLPDSIGPLLHYVLDRLESIFSVGMLSDALTLMECARHGLMEDELLELMHPPGRNRLPRATWARLYLHLELYLRPESGTTDTGQFDFFHRQFSKAVRRRYLQRPEMVEAVYERLAVYFRARADPAFNGRWQQAYTRSFSDLPYYQLRMGGRALDELRDSLCSLTFIERKCALSSSGIYDLIKDLEDCTAFIRNRSARLRARRRNRKRCALLRAHQLDFECADDSARTTVLGDALLVSSPSAAAGAAAGSGAASSIGGADADSVFGADASLPGTPRVLRPPRRASSMRSMVSVGAGMQEHSAYREELDKFAVSIRQMLTFTKSQARVLSEFPALTFQLALNQPNGSLPELLARELLSEGRVPQSWVVWRNKPSRIVKLFEHKSPQPIVCCCWSADNSSLFVTTADCRLLRVTVGSGDEERVLSQNKVAYTAVRASASGSLLLAAREDGAVEMWTPEPPSLMRVLNRPASDDMAAASSSGSTAAIAAAVAAGAPKVEDMSLTLGAKRLAVVAGRQLTIWNLRRGEVLGELRNNVTLRSVAYGPNGKQLVLGGSDGVVQLLDVASPALHIEVLRRMLGHTADVLALCFSPRGAYIASGSDDSTVRVWDGVSLRVLHVLQGHTAGVETIDFDLSERYLASGGHDSNLVLWDLSSGSPLICMNNHSGTVVACQFSVDGMFVLSGSRDCTLKVWNTETLSELVSQTDDEGGADASGQDLTIDVAAADAASSATALSVATPTADGSPARPRPPPLSLDARASSSLPPDSPATGRGRRRSVLHDLAHLLRQQSLGKGAGTPPHSPVASLAMSERVRSYSDAATPSSIGFDASAGSAGAADGEGGVSGSSAAAGGSDAGGDGAGAASTSASAAGLGAGKTNHTDVVKAVAFCPGSLPLLATGGADACVKVWHSGKVSLRHTFSSLGSGVTSLAFLLPLADSSLPIMLLAGTLGGGIICWDAEGGKLVVRKVIGKQRITLVSCSADNSAIYVGSADCQFSVLNRRLEMLFVGTSHISPPVATAVVPGTQLLLTCGQHGDLRCWDLQDGFAEKERLLTRWRPATHPVAITCIALSPCCRWLAVGTDEGKLDVYSLKTRRKVRIPYYGAFGGHGEAVLSLSYSADGDVLVSSGADHSIYVWDSLTGGRLASFLAEGRAHCCEIDASTMSFIAGDTTGQLYVLDIYQRSPGAIQLEQALQLAYLHACNTAAKGKKMRRAAGGRRGSAWAEVSDISSLDLSKVLEAPVVKQLSMDELQAWLVQQVASELHDAWRKPRMRPDGTYEPRLKTIGKRTYDIAALSFQQLPERYQKENHAAAQVACDSIYAAVEQQVALDDDFLEQAAEEQHAAWLKRNGDWAPPHQAVPYAELAEEEKEKDRTIVRKALAIYQPPTLEMAGEEQAAGQERRRRRRYSMLSTSVTADAVSLAGIALPEALTSKTASRSTSSMTFKDDTFVFGATQRRASGSLATTVVEESTEESKEDAKLDSKLPAKLAGSSASKDKAAVRAASPAPAASDSRKSVDVGSAPRRRRRRRRRAETIVVSKDGRGKKG